MQTDIEEFLDGLNSVERETLLNGLIERHRAQAKSDAYLAASWLSSLLKVAGRQDLADTADAIVTALHKGKE